MAAADKLIGTLRLDLSQLDGEIKRANTMLKSLGQGVNLDLSAEVMKAVEQRLQAITKAAEKYGSEMAKASSRVQQSAAGATSEISKVTKQVSTLTVATGDVKQVTEGFDALGRKVTEVSNNLGVLTRKTVNIVGNEKEAEQIKQLVALYRELAQAQTKMASAESAGKKNEMDYWREQANQISAAIERIIKDNERLSNAPDVVKARADQLNASLLALNKQVDVLDRAEQARADKAGEAQKAQQIRELISLYGQLGQAQSKMLSAQAAGKNSEAEHWSKQIDQITASIDRLLEKNRELSKDPGVSRARTEAINAENLAINRQIDAEERLRQAKAESASQSAAKADEAQRAQQIRELVSLYGQLGQAWSKAIEAENAGRTQEAGQWSQRADGIRQQINAILELNSALSKEEQVMAANQAAADAVAMARAKISDESEKEAQKEREKTSLLAQATNHYQALRTAVEDYQRASKAGNTTGVQEAQGRIEALGILIAKYENMAQALDKNSQQYKDIIALIERMKTVYQQYLGMVNGGTGAGSGTSDAEKAQQKAEQVVGRITSLVTNMILYRGLRKFWTEAKNFAAEYYNTIKEIQIVTQNTDSQMEQISNNFKSMAEELRVSMTDIAKGAVIFFRQGLSEEETENRLGWATKFSQISGASLEDSAQYITAVLNSMQSLEGNAQRVVDVFTYMGDNAATSGAEIATAMGKAAATADNAGMEFEFLAAAIASVSATTRQAPENIGTAFNTMMARLHSIKQKGYNDEDETKINDVAKALDRVGISLMDSNGEWRDFDAILTDVSRKWDTMTDKQQAYIATTMAGVRAQNYFIALMNDMSKGVEGGSKMWDLYYGAKGSEGIVDEKYGVWLTSMEAAQNKLTLAVQKFYDTLHMGDFFTGFLSGLSDVIGFLTRGVEVIGSANVATVALIGVIGGLLWALTYLATHLAVVGNAIMSAFSTNPVGMFIVALTVCITAVVALASAVDGIVRDWNKIDGNYEELLAKSKQKMEDLKTAIDNAKTSQQYFIDKAQDLTKLKDRYVELSTKVSLTKDEETELRDIINQIVALCPSLRTELDETSGSFRNQTQAVAELNAEIERNQRLAQLKGQTEAEATIFSEIAETSTTLSERGRVLSNAAKYEESYNNWLARQSDETLAYAKTQPNRDQYLFYKWLDEDAAVRMEGISSTAINYGATERTREGIWQAHRAYEQNVLELENDRQELLDLAYSTLGFYEDTFGLSDGVLEYARGRAQEEVYGKVGNGLSGGKAISRNSLISASQSLTDIYAEAHRMQTQIDNNPLLYGLQNKTSTAFENYQRLASGEGTADEIRNAAKEYNEAAQEFNDAYKTASKSNKEVYSLIKEGEEDLSKAKDLVEQQEQTDDVMRVVEQRRALKAARETGFAEQRRDLYDALYNEEGAIDRVSYERMADRIKNQNPYIWEDMMSDWKFRALDASVRQGFSDGGTQLASDEVINAGAQEVLSDTTAHWQEAAAAAQTYYDTVKQGTKDINTDEAFATTLLNAYNEGGIASVADRYNALLDENEDFTTAFMARHPEVAAMFTQNENGEAVPMEEFDVEAWLANVNALIPGTKENILGLVDVLGETGTTAEETIDAADRLLAVLNDEEALNNIDTKWSELDKTQQKVLKSLGIDETKFAGLKAGSKELQILKSNLQGLKTKSLESLNRVLNGTSNAVMSLSKGTKDWVSYQKTLFQGIDTATKLQGAYEVVMDKSKEGTEEYAEALTYLSQQTGLTAEQLGTTGGMAQALLYVQNQTEVVQGSIEALAGSLLSMNGVTFDPSQIVDGYIALGEGAEEGAVMVMDLVNTALKLLGATISFTPDGTGGGYFTVNGISGKTPTAKTTDTGKGGGGGGGGGGKKDTFSDRLAAITAQMGRSVDKYKELLERLSLYESMYSDQGELTNVLRVQEQRRRVLIDQQEAYEKILEDLPGLIAKAKEEMAKYKEDSEDYKKALSDLQNLEDSYASYTQELIKNRAEQLKNADAIRETQEAIVQLESNLRNTIQSVIMDRENREKASLAARISMEGEVLDAIQKRYEKERDEIIETTDLRIESLNKETNALSDALEERKNLAEDADKMDELLNLQDQYARIVADPTRAKEAKEIAKKIADLQEEIGWTVAEREVEARQKEIEEEINSLEDYEKSTEKYYEALLEDPRNFIEEYNRILSGTDAEIINWLMENSENYVKATDASREQLLQGWKDTLDELRMYTRTVWDEVEQIISLGDGGIMEFLLENSQEYREANAYGKLDLIYQWEEMLKDRHAAYVDTFEELEYMEFTNTLYDWVTYLIAQSKSSGGGGGGGKNKLLSQLSTEGLTADQLALIASIAGVIGSEFNPTPEQLQDGGRSGNLLDKLGTFASGGLAYGTGLARLDGTAGLPERVLSPEQTMAFERLVDFITSPGRIMIPGLNGGMAPAWNTSAGAVFGDINITVESLDSDTDVDNLADKLMDAINERMTRGMAVGGIAMGY